MTTPNRHRPHEHRDHHDHHGQSHGFDEETARWYVENYGDHPTNRMTVALARLEPDDLVVDVGCGGGEAIREAAARVPEGKAIGVDPSAAMMRIARELSDSHAGRKRIEFVEGRAEKLPLPDASATVVVAINSLHHWENAAAGLAEVMRVLRPDGRLLVTDEEAEPDKFGHGDGDLTDPARVLAIIKDAGFVDVCFSKHTEGDVRMLAVTARKDVV
ncbi:MAG: methyltransferase domain-containing protein [Acidobacteriota bacterium]|nr:methyltransferase domain-containing protein [Acidobacteriota bacterium]